MTDIKKIAEKLVQRGLAYQTFVVLQVDYNKTVENFESILREELEGNMSNDYPQEQNMSNSPLAEKIRNMLIDNRDNFESWSIQKQDQVIQQVIDHHLSDLEKKAREWFDKYKDDPSPSSWYAHSKDNVIDILTQFTNHLKSK